MDEFFTLTIGGMVTVLNTSGQPIHPVSMKPLLQLPATCTVSLLPAPSCEQGDLVEWCFFSEKGTHAKKRARAGPRRFGITIASVSSPKVIGRALSFAKAGEQLDMLLKQ